MPSEDQRGGEIPDGGQIPISNTVSEVDLDQLFNTLNKPTVDSLKRVIRGFARSYEGVGPQANQGFHYLNPFLSTSRRVFSELNSDQANLDGLVVDGASLMSTLDAKSPEISSLVANLNGIKLKSVKQSSISAAVREPMLSAGQIDAVTGFSYLSAINLRDRGVPADDLAVLKFADYGCEAYGFAVVVNPAFAAAKPEAVKGFVRALIAGIAATVKEPARAADEAASRIDGGDRDLELERLRTVLADNLLTDEVKRNGLGGVDPARLDRSIGQIARGFKFRKKPAASDIFDDRFLPPVTERLIN